jgi:hypothetical protein
MDKDVILWIFGFILTGLGMCIGGMLAWAFSTSQRLTKVETIVSLLAQKAAEILHSPHTPELDAMLEKYLRTYTDRGYELTRDEWDKLREMCSLLEKDESLAKGERLLAGIINAVCTHKLKLPKYVEPVK